MRKPELGPGPGQLSLPRLALLTVTERRSSWAQGHGPGPGTDSQAESAASARGAGPGRPGPLSSYYITRVRSKYQWPATVAGHVRRPPRVLTRMAVCQWRTSGWAGPGGRLLATFGNFKLNLPRPGRHGRRPANWAVRLPVTGPQCHPRDARDRSNGAH